MRSDMIKVGVDKAPARGLLYATGQVKSAKDMQKPFIAICNSYIDIVPGHVHLRELADVAKEAIREMGGIPFELTPNKETIEAMEEAKRMTYDSSVKGYDNLDELFEELKS